MKKILSLSVLLICLVLGGIKQFFYAYDKSNYCHFNDCGFEFVGKYKYLNTALQSISNNVEVLNKMTEEYDGKWLGHYKRKFDYGGWLDISVYQHNASLFPSKLKGKSFLEGIKNGLPESSTTISDIHNGDSIVLKYVTHKPYKSSSSVIYKNGIVYFITITNSYDYTSGELYDMIIPHMTLINVKMKQIQGYAFSFFIFVLAGIIVFIIHLCIKKYRQGKDETEKTLSYGGVLMKVLWPYMILCASVLTIINIIHPYDFQIPYIIMYAMLFLYYLNIIIRKRDFGLKQIFFYDIMVGAGFIKKDWDEVKIRKKVLLRGAIPFIVFYVIPWGIISLYHYHNGYINSQMDDFYRDHYRHNSIMMKYDIDGIGDKIHEFRMEHNIDGICDALTISCITIFFILCFCVLLLYWVHSPQKQVEKNGENK